ncbi:hypothetical protein [Streptomyces olivaceiscleroticus]|uniref:Pyridoxamine 5'-phosphate oxidase putative domain-containing protein n=1 Tax=Streptomyces olivaceiscleroticus TaxID=68245 RepID=A0ABN0ZVI0_9ACTN
MTETVPQPLLDQALIEEATKKSGLIWVQGTEGPSRALWHVWHDGAACLVGDGPLEQPLADLGLADGATATVTVRSKDKGGRLVAWTARVAEAAPHSEPWEAAVGELKGKRLNAPDADTMPERWARECRVLRLTPHTEAGAPDVRTEFGEDAGAARPLPSAATTRGPLPAALPKLLRRRRRG